jgi:membrane associated rhomboid family serine protease
MREWVPSAKIVTRAGSKWVTFPLVNSSRIESLHHWWSLVSVSYLHGSLLHLIFNLIALRQIGG